MKSLLVVKHGGPSKRNALEVARRLTNVVVVDDDGDYDCGEPCLHVSELTAEAVLQVIAEQHLHFDACLTFVDPATVVTADIAARLSVPSLSVPTATTIKDKLAMRNILGMAGIQWPRFAELHPHSRPRAYGVGFPCVLKPVEGAYGLGIARVNNEKELVLSLRKAEAEILESSFARYLSRRSPVRWMVESYLDGPEFSIEILGHPTTPRVLAAHEKAVTEFDGEFREDRFVTAPAQLTHAELHQVEAEAVRICRILGFTRGVGNLEARLTSQGLGVLELQTCPTGGLVAGMVQASHGLNLHELHVRAFLDIVPEPPPRHQATRACAMEILHADRPGHFRISGIDEAKQCPGVKLIQVLATEGDVVAVHSEYLGFLVCEAASAAMAQALLKSARKVLRVETEAK